MEYVIETPDGEVAVAADEVTDVSVEDNGALSLMLVEGSVAFAPGRWYRWYLRGMGGAQS